MEYKVEIEKKALKQLRKIDKQQQRLIRSWVETNLVGSEDPRKIGKQLKGNLNEYWRYRVGSYRIIADINDDKVMITVVRIGHRKDIYDIG